MTSIAQKISKQIVQIRSHLGPFLTKSTVLLVSGGLAATIGSFIAVTMPIPGGIAPREGQQLLSDLFKNGFRYQIKRPVNVLVMGIDQVAGAKVGSEEIFSGNSDSMLLLNIDPKQSGVSLLSIPRDTQVEIPNLGLTKINQANPAGGPALVNQVIADNFDGVSIDRYVRFSTYAFRELINQVGGIEVTVPTDMVYEDKTQKLSINLKQGRQSLDGEKAEQFARFRNDALGDVGRVQRQQILLKALREKFVDPLVIVRIPLILQAIQPYIDTNLTLAEISALLNHAVGIDQKSIKMVLLPGRFSGEKEFQASYWIMDPEARDRIMKEYFNVGMGQADGKTSPLRVVIQNASNNPDAAQAVLTQLNRAGYENVSVSDDRAEQQTQTQIIVQGGQNQAAESIQNIMGIGIVESSSIGELESDITLRIGNDIGRQKL